AESGNGTGPTTSAPQRDCLLWGSMRTRSARQPPLPREQDAALLRKLRRLLAHAARQHREDIHAAPGGRGHRVEALVVLRRGLREAGVQPRPCVAATPKGGTGPIGRISPERLALSSQRPRIVPLIVQLMKLFPNSSCQPVNISPGKLAMPS